MAIADVDPGLVDSVLVENLAMHFATEITRRTKMRPHVNSFIEKTIRVFPSQGRYGKLRYDMNENPEGVLMVSLVLSGER